MHQKLTAVEEGWLRPTPAEARALGLASKQKMQVETKRRTHPLG